MPDVPLNVHFPADDRSRRTQKWSADQIDWTQQCMVNPQVSIQQPAIASCTPTHSAEVSLCFTFEPSRKQGSKAMMRTGSGQGDTSQMFLGDGAGRGKIGRDGQLSSFMEAISIKHHRTPFWSFLLVLLTERSLMKASGLSGLLYNFRHRFEESWMVWQSWQYFSYKLLLASMIVHSPSREGPGGLTMGEIS